MPQAVCPINVKNGASLFLAGWGLVHFGRHMKWPAFTIYDDFRELKCPANAVLAACYGGSLCAYGNNQLFGLCGALTVSFALQGQYQFCTCRLSLRKFDTWSKLIPLTACVYILASSLRARK